MYRQISCNIISPRDRVCLGNIGVNTLHKGENVNNSNNNNKYTGTCRKSFSFLSIRCNIHDVCPYFQSSTTPTLWLCVSVWLPVATSSVVHHETTVKKNTNINIHYLPRGRRSPSYYIKIHKKRISYTELLINSGKVMEGSEWVLFRNATACSSDSCQACLWPTLYILRGLRSQVFMAACAKPIGWWTVWRLDCCRPLWATAAFVCQLQLPWWWRRLIRLKRRCTFSRLRDVKYQNTALLACS